MMSLNASLRDRILSAPSERAVSDLLNSGSEYEYASDATRNRWKEAAKRRLRELSHPKKVENLDEAKA